MKITILKTHQSHGQWFHAGMTIEEDALRAKELLHVGLAVAAMDKGEEKTEKAARPVTNKAAMSAKNK